MKDNATQEITVKESIPVPDVTPAGEANKEKKDLRSVKLLTYKQAKGTLQEQFDKFMANPIDFGIDEKTAEQLTKAGPLQKHFVWSKFKDQLQVKMSELSHKELASAFIIDFEQDEDHQLTTIKQLKEIFKKPQDPKYALEDDTVKRIQGLDKKQKKALMQEIAAQDKDLNPEDLENPIAKKIVAWLKEVWEKIAPAIKNIADKLIDVALAALEKLLDDKVPGYIEIDKDAKASKIVAEKATTAEADLTKTKVTVKAAEVTLETEEPSILDELEAIEEEKDLAGEVPEEAVN